MGSGGGGGGNSLSGCHFTHFDVRTRNAVGRVPRDACDDDDARMFGDV